MSKKASDQIRYYHNPGGPLITTVNRKIIEKDRLFFKDLDGSGEWKPFDDWRLPAGERAKAFAEALTVDEKIGQLFVSDWRMGLYQKDKTKLDASGLLDEAELEKNETIFVEQDLPGTTYALKEWFVRHMILRSNPKPDELADWINQLHAVAEECEHFVPVQVISNSRNENGEVVFGMNDATGVFATWPGTLGIAAAIKGDKIELADAFADCIRREWDAVGMKKGYMYMADVVTDPRWQRTYGTFGEDPELVCEIIERIVPIIQGGKDGVTEDGVAMTVKHFPGGGARENGFDPHYAMGQWNVYATEGSLEKYHLPAFQVAIDNNVSSIMPYYAKPAKEKSAGQLDKEGNPMEMLPYGFAFNKPFIDNLLRRQMGFKGYVNSDSGVTQSMNWGVEMLDVPERVGYAINHAGVDIISGSFDISDAKEAYERGKNDYYDTHPVPEGFTKDELVLTEEVLNRAVARTLRELFELGMFENPYRDPEQAVEVVANRKDWENAQEVHRKSVTLLKNDGTLPLTKEKLKGKKVYVECFHKNHEAAERETADVRKLMAEEVTLTENYETADYAILLLNPSSGEYFNATPGYLELEICEEKTVPNVDEEGRLTAETHKETTLSGVKRIHEISRKLHEYGGKVIANVNITLAWEVGNIEPYVDAFMVGYDTYPAAVLDVITGKYAPTGRLPLTLPRNDDVIAVNQDGVCISPNDVPGYDKDQYIPEHLKDENGKAYAYRDQAGNYYELNFGLNYMLTNENHLV